MRERILAGDFATSIKAVQNFPSDEIDMRTVIEKAIEIKSPNFTVEKAEDTGGGAVKMRPTGRSISERGRNLKNRLSVLLRTSQE